MAGTLELSFAERRVLGVLIEKGFTTPEQYPLSLNAVVVASNQKSCRDPIANLDEEAALDSLEALRKKGLATLVRMEGSRVDRWKHRFGETLGLGPREVAIIAELLLRGPQTDGEIRSRAGRMTPLPDLDEVTRILESLGARPEPLVERLGPPGRRRGVKFAHRFYPPAEQPHDDGESNAEADVASYRREATAPAQSPSRHEAEGPGGGYPAMAAGDAGFTGGADSAGVDPDTVSALRREILSLRERVEELEATFVKFLR